MGLPAGGHCQCRHQPRRRSVASRRSRRGYRHHGHQLGRRAGHPGALHRADARARQRRFGGHRQRGRDSRPALPRRLLRQQGRPHPLARKPARGTAAQRRESRHPQPRLYRNAHDGGQSLSHALSHFTRRVRASRPARHRRGSRLRHHSVADGVAGQIPAYRAARRVRSLRRALRPQGPQGRLRTLPSDDPAQPHASRRQINAGARSRAAASDPPVHAGEQQAANKNQRAQHEHLRRNADLHRAIDPQRKSQLGARDEVGDDHVVDRQSESQRPSPDDAGQDERQGDISEGLPGRGAKVGRGAVEQSIQPGNPRAYHGHHESQFERHMRDQDGQQALRHVQRDEKRQQRSPHDDRGRGNIDEHQQVRHRLAAKPPAPHGQRHRRAEQQRNRRTAEGDLERMHQRRCQIGDAKGVPVPISGEAMPEQRHPAIGRLVEAVHHHDHDGNQDEGDDHPGVSAQ